MLAISQVSPTRKRRGKSNRVTDPEASALSTQPGLLVRQAAYRGTKMRTDDRMGSIPGLLHARARRNKLPRSIGATETEISTLRAQPDLALHWTACYRRRCRPMTGWARKSKPAVLNARATSSRFGSSFRATDSRISRLSARPDFIPRQAALRGGKGCRSTAGWARNSKLGLQPARTRRDGLGTSIRVADPQVSAPSAQARSILCRVARWGTECRSAAGWPRNSPASATCDKLGNSVRVADSQVSTLSARPDPIHCQMACRGTRIRSTAGWARNSVEAALRVRATGSGNPSGSRIPRHPRSRARSV